MSAVIYAAIFVIWLIVLVPMWLRRHDTLADERSSDRFEGAMRVLARRPAAGPDRRYIVMPQRSAASKVHVSGAPTPVMTQRFAPAEVEASPFEVDPAAERVAREPREPREPLVPKAPRVALTAAQRRVRSLTALGALSVMFFVLGIAHVMPWAIQLLPELLLVGFVVYLRRSAPESAAVTRHRSRATVAPERRPVARAARQARPAAEVFVSLDEVYDDRRHAAAPAAVHAQSTESDPVYSEPVYSEPVFFEPAAVASYDVFSATDFDQPAAVEEPVAVRHRDAQELPPAVGAMGSTWTPAPVPRPTYAMKPRAPYRPSPQRDFVEDPEIAALADDPQGNDLDLILDHRWAVND